MVERFAQIYDAKKENTFKITLTKDLAKLCFSWHLE
jgi:hypothetical protein